MKFCSKCGLYLSYNCLKSYSAPKWHCPRCNHIEEAGQAVQVVHFKQSENLVSVLSKEAVEVYKNSRKTRSISKYQRE